MMGSALICGKQLTDHLSTVLQISQDNSNSVVWKAIDHWLGYRGGSPTADQAWQPCPLWELSPSHPILL